MSAASLPQDKSAYCVFISSDNLRLAWERVRYFDRPDSRDWIGLKVFAANRDHNLELLRQSLIERTFVPSYPEIRYVPKPSLTLRPMAMLPVRDRVVFQAVVNVVAERGRSALAVVANRQSFANVLAASGQKQFFVPWKRQYHLFQNKFCALVEEGNTWLAETDIAAFYETIDHSMLSTRLRDGRFLDDQVLEHLEYYLPTWGSVRRGTQTTRGVPQGCLASDLLAAIYLSELDRDLAVQGYHYLRYVDDIRILAQKKEAVQRGLIRVDMTLKSIGLLLQTTKTTVRPITNLSEETDRLAAQLSELDRRVNEPDLPEEPPPDPLIEPSLQDVALLGEEIDIGARAADIVPTAQESLRELFWKSKRAIDSNNGDPFAERHLRFCLYRLTGDDVIVAAVLPYFVDRPWLSELIAAYLHRCELEQQAIETLRTVIQEHNVYDSVVALAIEVLIRQGVSQRSQDEMFRQWLTGEGRDWPLLCAAAMALGETSDNMLVLLEAMSSRSPSVRRMALIQALRLARDQGEASHILRRAITDDEPLVADACLYQLYNEWALTLRDLEPSGQPLPEYCVASAKGYDTTLPAIQPDYVRTVFTRDYGVELSYTIDFHVLLGSFYGHASEFLWQAQNSFLVNPSRYVSQLDLFHEELLFPILVDKLRWKLTREELVKVELGNRIEYLSKNVRALGSFGDALRQCHDLRCSCTEAHTRLHRQLTATSPVTWRKRDGLRKHLRAGYQELVDWL